MERKDGNDISIIISVPVEKKIYPAEEHYALTDVQNIFGAKNLIKNLI